MTEIELDRNIKLPEHPHLRSLRRTRKEILRRMVVLEGERVGGLRSENEMLGRILEETETGEAQEEWETEEEEQDGGAGRGGFGGFGSLEVGSPPREGIAFSGFGCD